MPLQDQTTKIFLTPDGAAGDISPKMQAFLNYLAGQESTDEFTARLDNAVHKVRDKEEWRLEYMMLFMRDREYFEKGVEQGMEQGIEKGIQQGIEQGIEKGIQQGMEQGIDVGENRKLLKQISKKLERGLTVQEIAEDLEESVESIEALIKELE